MRNTFKILTLGLGMLFFLPFNSAKAQINIYMNHSGTEKVGHSDIMFYDNGGPSLGPDYYWERWYSHNLDYTIVFEPKVVGEKIKVTFNTFTAYTDNGGTNHALDGEWALRINDDHLYIYDGAGTDPSKLIADLTGSIRAEFTLMATGSMTFRFKTNNRFREEGWAATVEAIADAFAPTPPIILKDACSTDISLFSNAGYTIFYTTNGSTPTYTYDSETGVFTPGANTTQYSDPFNINLAGESSNVTVKALATNGTLDSEVASVPFTHNDYVPDPGNPSISISGNTVTMTAPAVPSYLNETYNVYYTTDNSDPTSSGTAIQYTDPFEWYTPGITIKACTRAYSCENKVSDVAEQPISTVTVPNPVITFDNSTDQATITCSLPGATIYYTTDDSTPTSSSTTYSSAFNVSLGATVKAIAYHSGEGYENSGYSGLVSAIYTKGQASGVSGSIVFLDDREDHNWSYYKKYTKMEGGVEVPDDEKNSPIHRWNPADVKITYYGNGTGNMTNASENGDAPTTFSANATGALVGPTPGEAQSTFVYLKTLERQNEDGTGNLPYTIIPNPFQVRPVYLSREGEGNPENPETLDPQSLPQTLVESGQEPLETLNDRGQAEPETTNNRGERVAKTVTYTQNFDATTVGQRPSGWDAPINNTGSNSTKPAVAAYNTGTGVTMGSSGRKLLMQVESSGGALTGTEGITTVVLPKFDHMTSITFDYIQSTSDRSTLYVGWYNGSSYQTSNQITLSAATSTPSNITLNSTSYSALFNNVNSNQNYRLAIRLVRTPILGGNGTTYAGIDNVSVTYELNQPTFNYDNGHMFPGTSSTVTITRPDANTTVYYTLDGTDPTTSSPNFTTSTRDVTVSITNPTLKAIAVHNNSGHASYLTEATYQFNLRTPGFSPDGGWTFEGATSGTVTITRPDANTTVYYTLDGTDPTTSSPNYFTTSTHDVTVDLSHRTLKAIAVSNSDSGKTSAINSGTYSFALITPTFTPVGGSFPGQASLSVTINNPNSGTTLYYTRDGSDPSDPDNLNRVSTTESSVSGVTMGEDGGNFYTTLKAIAIHGDTGFSSEIATATYSFQLNTPTISPNGQLFFGSSLSVSITNGNTGATVYYTTDGSTPTTGSSVYSSAFTITGNTTVKAMAASGHLTSGIAEAVFVKGQTVSDASQYRGFYKWRVKRLSNGLKIKINGTDYDNSDYATIPFIDADTEVQFVTSNEYDNEVEFEALWAQAYVVTCSSSNGLSTAMASGNLNNSVGYERNFVVVTGGTQTTAIDNASQKPVTISGLYPNGYGTVNSSNYISANFTANKDTKFENIYLRGNASETNYTYTYVKRYRRTATYYYYHENTDSWTTTETGATVYTLKSTTSYNVGDDVNSGTSQGGNTVYYYIKTKTTGPTVNYSQYVGNGNDLVFGRGILHTAAGHAVRVKGVGSGGSSLNYTIRIESGVVQKFYAGHNNGSTTGSFSSTCSIKAVLGCDYDRAKNDNSKLSVSPSTHPGEIYGGTRMVMSSDANKDNLTFDWYIKSGKFHDGLLGKADGGDESIYMGSSQAGGTDYLQYIGKRRMTIEGGELASIAGGMNSDAASGGYNNTYTTGEAKDNVYIRMRGGHVRGAIYGAAAFAGAKGGRTFVFTGGSVNGWIAGGCNGTASSGGELYGSTYIYVGGNAKVVQTGDHPFDAPDDPYIGTEHVLNTANGTGAYGGNIFGAGCGLQPMTYNTSGNPVEVAYTNPYTTVGKVYGSTIVVADDAEVGRDIYGGGKFGFVAGDASDGSYGLADNTDMTSRIYILGGTVHGDIMGGSNCQINQQSRLYIRGGQLVGRKKNNPSDLDLEYYGDVYGGCDSWGELKGTATIQMTGGTVTNIFGSGYGAGSNVSDDVFITISGGKVKGTVYGGGESGTVAGNTNITILGGTVNDVFGAGKGLPSKSQFALVSGTTTVTIDGGTVLGTVYGGGEGGKQNSHATVNLKRGEVRGDVFGGALGTSGVVYVRGMHTVNVTGGHVFGNLYGGSKRANDALADITNATIESNISSGAVDNTVCVVNISGGRMDRNVYGSGYFGLTNGSVYVFIGREAILCAPNYSYNLSSEDYTISNLKIVRSVWAGADWGSNEGEFGDPTIAGYSNIYVDGTGYDVSSNNGSNATYMNIGESLLACGTSSEAGKKGRFVIVRNYGALVDNAAGSQEPYAKASRTFFSIQRPTYLVIDNSHFNLSGQGLVNSTVNTEQYGLYEVTNALYLTNGSSLFFDAPARQLKKFVSASNSDVYTNTPNSGPTGYTVINIAHEDFSELEAKPNKICVAGGNYLKIHHQVGLEPVAGEPYGELSGFSYLMTSGTKEGALIYARPKDSDVEGNGVESGNDNSSDGGWVAYKTALNEFTFPGGAMAEGGGSDQVAYENHILTSKNGEEHFRIWRTDGDENYREGVLNARSNGTDTFSTTEVVISLPPFHSNGSYYRFKTESDATTISYGSDVRTYNAANYKSDNWMYYAGTSDGQIKELSDSDTRLATAIENIKSKPNVNFGMVIMPTQGFSSAIDTLIVCQESDGLLAASTTRFPNANNGADPLVTFRLTYSNLINSNASYDPMTIEMEQISTDGKVLETVTIVLGVNTITNIESEQNIDLYAVMRNQTLNPSLYTGKLVLPTFSVYNAEVHSSFKVKSVTFEAANQNDPEPTNFGDFRSRNAEFDHNKFAVTFSAASNPDNTNGWYDNYGEKDAYTLLDNESSANYFTIGTCDGRTKTSINFNLWYDGEEEINFTGLMGTLTFNMEFDNYKNSSGEEVNNQSLTVKVKVYRRGTGTNFYIDGQHGAHSNDGRNPDDAVLKFSTIFNRLGYMPGDKIYIVNTIPVDNEREWNGVSYGGCEYVYVYRYPGNHELSDGTMPTPESPFYNAFTGPLVTVQAGGDLAITDITVDGHNKDTHDGDGPVTAQAPLFTVENEGILSLNFDADLQNNTNGSESLYGGAVNVAEGGTVMMNSNAEIKDNVSSKGGGIYMDGTLVVSDQVKIKDNYSSGTTQNNVLLAGPTKVVQIGTNTLDDDYGALNTSAEIGVTKLAEGNEDGYIKVTGIEDEYDIAWLDDPYVRPNTIVFHDGGRYQLEKYTDARYLYWLFNTWVQAVTSEPSEFSTAAINTPEELAWLISLVNAENSQSAHTYAGETVTLTGDIDMGEYLWVPIGDSDHSKKFSGTFNGNGHTIEGLSNGSLVRDDMGLFGLAEDATIKDVIVKTDFSGTFDHIGGIAGTMNGGTISGSGASGTITGSANGQNLGGLVGTTTGTTHIKDSYSAVAIIGEGSSTVMGGIVSTLNSASDLKNSFANPAFDVNGDSPKIGGLVGVNEGTVENCYSRLRSPEPNNFGWFAHTNTPTAPKGILYCYAPTGKTTYVKTNSGNLANHGNYDPTVLVSDKYGYEHQDQDVTVASGQTNGYILNGAIDDNGELKGLLATLNKWVAANPTYTPWTRTMASHINGDYPVHKPAAYNCVGSKDGVLIEYDADVNDMIDTYNGNLGGGHIYLYNATYGTAGTGTTVSTNTDSDVRVYIDENVGILQTAATINARVGVTFDNSKGVIDPSNPLWGKPYDWHMFSSALEAAPLGLVYNTSSEGTAYSNNVPLGDNNTDVVTSTVYNDRTKMDPPQTTWNTTNYGYFPTDTPYGPWRSTDSNEGFDFYCYSEPDYHWINLKREGVSGGIVDHWHQDVNADGDHQKIQYYNESTLLKGKGYLMAIGKTSMLMADGTLTNGEFTTPAKQVSYTADVAYPGINLIGNPYQSYLDFQEFAKDGGENDGKILDKAYYMVDADHSGYITYPDQASPNPEYAPRYIHPHQGFIVAVPDTWLSTDKLTFNNGMRVAGNWKNGGDLEYSDFREERLSYPLINLLCYDGNGKRDLTTVEINRPDVGGARKMKALRISDVLLSAHFEHRDYQALFAPEGVNEVPVRFEAFENEVFTMKWSMYNGDFHYAHLIDNLTGADIDLLVASEYKFEASTGDYVSRFRLVFDVTGIDEPQTDDDMPGSTTFAFQYGDELIVTGKGTLQFFDLNGRCLLSTNVEGEQSSIALPQVAKGVYLLRLTGSKQTQVQKIIIK